MLSVSAVIIFLSLATFLCGQSVLLRFAATLLNYVASSHCLNTYRFQWSLEIQLQYSPIYPSPMSLLIPFPSHTLLQSCDLMATCVGCRCQGVGNGERAAGVASKGLLHADTAGSCQLQWTHCRTQLSPSAVGGAPLGKPVEKGQKAVE